MSTNVASPILILIPLIKNRETLFYFPFSKLTTKMEGPHQCAVVPTGQATYLSASRKQRALCVYCLLRGTLNAATKMLPHLHVKVVPTQNTPRINDILKLRINLC